MQRHFTCHLIDLPSAGQTKLLNGTEFGITAHTQTVRDAMARLRLSHYALVAHDSGDRIAHYVAQTKDDAVTNLMLTGTEIPKHHSTLLKLFMALHSLPTGAWRTVMSIGFLRQSRLMLNNAFKNPTHGEGKFHKLMITPLITSNEGMDRPMKFLRTLNPREIDDLDRMHTNITAPTLLIQDSNDRFFPTDGAKKMTKQFNGPTTFMEIPNKHTFMHDKQAERFTELTCKHLAKTTNRVALRAS